VKLPLGYRYSAVFAGIRKVQQNDLALIVPDQPASAAAVFTQNRVQAAPVRIGRFHLTKSRGLVSAVLINAGNANCATRTGDRVALACCDAVAKHLHVPPEQVFPSSTGVIGVELDAHLIVNALPELIQGLAPNRFEDAARAILTTDTVMKTAQQQVRLKQGAVHIAGMTKGSGMIHPNMATTLGFVMLDAAIPATTLASMLATAVKRSYNRISVDGDTSTNDTLLVLANGAAEAPAIKAGTTAHRAFTAALEEVCRSLALQIVADGEGAQRVIEIEVRGAKTEANARRIAETIATSPLVKTAFAGGDPNWGRIFAAAGRSGVAFDTSRVDIHMAGIPVLRRGQPLDFNERAASNKLLAKHVPILMDLHAGREKARYWTCDFTAEYVRINASYRT
jgi:glutamate N-acetyltransferase/amino-acid N-acetyltransferase